MNNSQHTILDHIDNINVPGSVFKNPVNEYWALICLWKGMSFLYHQAKRCDDALRSRVNPNDTTKYMGMANLGQSLFELGRCVEEGECLKSLEDVDTERFKLNLDVWPVWTLMKPNEFRSGTVELFGSSKGVLEFVFKSGVSLEKFWGWWKKWKKICVHNMMRGELQIRAMRILHGDFLLLPGEPSGK